MIRTLLAGLLLAGMVCGTAIGWTQAKAPAAGKVCPDPNAPCRSPHKRFADYELSFRLPARIRDNTAYPSAPFYAVVLMTAREADCDGGEYSKKIEAERRRAQRLFPGRKVFADHQCPDMGAVAYQIDGRPNTGVFIAVYAGETQAEARRVLEKAKGSYRGASVKRMRVVFERIMQ